MIPRNFLASPIGNAPGYRKDCLLCFVGTFYPEIIDVLMELFTGGVVIVNLKTENAIIEMFTPIQWMKGLLKVYTDPVIVWRFLSCDGIYF